MFKKQVLFIITLSVCYIIFLTSCNSQVEVIALPDSLLREASIKKSSGFKAEKLEINLLDYHISSDTHGNLLIKDQSLTSKKSLSLGKNLFTHKLHFFHNDHNIILFYELTDNIGLFNKVYCLNKRSRNLEWQTELGHFSLSIGRSEKNILYLGSTENAYALNIENGKIIWQTHGLYHQHGFYYFDKIEIKEQTVSLSGKTIENNIKEDKTAVLDKKTGKVLSIDFNTIREATPYTANNNL